MIPKKLPVDSATFNPAFSRDGSFSNPDAKPYLSKKTSYTICVYDEDRAAEWYGYNPAENKFHREQIEKNPEQYLFIENTFHGDYHSMLLSFFDSDWTDDKKLKMLVKDCYQNSIGGWKTNVRNNPLISIDPEEVIALWHQFVDAEMKKMMEKYLIDNNINYEWC